MTVEPVDQHRSAAVKSNLEMEAYEPEIEEDRNLRLKGKTFCYEFFAFASL